MTRDEENIRFRDLIYGLLGKWKFILFGTIIFSVLLPVFKYKIDWNNYTKSITKENIEFSDKTEFNLMQNEILDIEECILIENKIKEFQEYLNQNKGMQTSPFKLEIYRLQYYIKVLTQNADEGIDRTVDLGALYTQNILAQEHLEKIEESLPFQEEDLLSLIDVSCSDSGAILNIDLLLSQDITFDKDLFLKSINEIIFSIHETLNNICEHEIESISQTEQTITSTEFTDAQIKLISQIQTLQNYSDSMKAKFSEQQLNCYNFLTNRKESSEKNTDDLSKPPTMNLKYMLVGLLTGFLLMIFLTAYFILASNKLLNIEMIKNRSGVKFYGTLDLRKKRHKKNAFFQKDNLSIEALATFIKIDCERKKISKLYMLGTALADTNSEIILPILNTLSEAGIHVIVRGNIVQNPEILEECMQGNMIVVVEKLGESNCNMVHKEFDILKDYKLDILGAFFIDNR